MRKLFFQICPPVGTFESEMNERNSKVENWDSGQLTPQDLSKEFTKIFTRLLN